MEYTIKLTKKAKKFIKSQQPKQQERLLKSIAKLPTEGDIKSLSGNQNAYRLRVGDYRVIYEVEHNVLLVTVLDVGNRGQIYNSI